MAIRDRYDPVKLFFRRLGIAMLLFLVVAAVSGVWNAYWKQAESREMRVEAEHELEKLRTQDTQLQAEIAKLKTDRGKEEALREQYDVGKHGENLIVIVDPPQTEPIQATSSPIMRFVRKFLPFW